MPVTHFTGAQIILLGHSCAHPLWPTRGAARCGAPDVREKRASGLALIVDIQLFAAEGRPWRF
jgi:hypothetical protein